MPTPSSLAASLLLLLLSVSAQSPSRNSSSSISPTPSPSLSLSLTTSQVVLTTATRAADGHLIPTTTTGTTVFNITVTLAPSPALATSTPTPAPIVLDTKLDPAFAVLGTLLVLTGIPSAFWGHKNRWTSFFLIGFYTLSLVCLVLILKFGVLPAVNPPSKKLRGMFVLSSVVAGITGGGVTIFFWKGAKFFIGAWGGFALALFIQCLQDGGVIKQIGLRWILFIGCGVAGFVLCTIPKIHYHILLVSTALVGATAFMLGVDCFTTAGLKEFYIWNLGFRSLFPKYTNNGIQFPVSQTMQIELGLMGAVALMGIAVQLRILTVLQRKLREIAEEQRKRDEEAETEAASRFAGVLKEKDDWEKAHPTARHGRNISGNSMMPLMKDHDGSTSPTTDEQHSTFTLVSERRPRYQSGVSDFQAIATLEEEAKRPGRAQQSPGALPALDLGLGIQEEVPRNFIAQERSSSPKKILTVAQLEEIKRKEELLAEIQQIRKSIDVLKSEVPSRNPSQTSSAALATVATSTHPRPPRETDPRTRFHSLDLQTLPFLPKTREPISRPSSAPLRDNDWDSYVRERKLMQPPSGITPPIATTTILSPAPRMAVPTAVAEALTQRRRREGALESGEIATATSSDDLPVANVLKAMQTKNSQLDNAPLSVPLPRRPSPVAAAHQPTSGGTRVRTLEELNQRHREKLHDLQAPLTQAEQAHANLEAAKIRWERSKTLERDAVMKRQAEKAALLKEAEKRRKSEDELERGARRSVTMKELRPDPGRHSRSLSADKLATLGTVTSTRRLSTMKVEDWQRYQQESDTTPIVRSGSRRGARSPGIPFPEDTRYRDMNHERRKTGTHRDPLN